MLLCLTPPGIHSEVKPNPMHLHCAVVCTADYPLTEDYTHFATHSKVLKHPAKFSNANKYSLIILSLVMLMKSFIYLKSLT